MANRNDSVVFESEESISDMPGVRPNKRQKASSSTQEAPEGGGGGRSRCRRRRVGNRFG